RKSAGTEKRRHGKAQAPKSAGTEKRRHRKAQAPKKARTEKGPHGKGPARRRSAPVPAEAPSAVLRRQRRWVANVALPSAVLHGQRDPARLRRRHGHDDVAGRARADPRQRLTRRPGVAGGAALLTGLARFSDESPVHLPKDDLRAVHHDRGRSRKLGTAQM